MNIRICLALACALFSWSAEAREKSPGSPLHNLVSTRNHYSRLIAGGTPRLAELTLFTNLLPKGADLHHHYSGSIYAETYLDWVGARNYCVYRASDPAQKTSSPARTIEKFRIETQPQELSEAARRLCIGADEVRKDNNFYRDLLKRWSDKDYDNHFHEQAAPDQQFFDTFGYFGPVSGSNFGEGLKSLKARAKAENLGYMETMLRGSPAIANPDLDKLLNGLDPGASAQRTQEALAEAYGLLTQDPTAKDQVDAYLKVIENAAADLDDEEFRLRFIAYVSRNGSPAQVFSGLYSAFAAASRSDWVVGVNIVGPENGHVAMRDYGLHMRMFAFLKQYFPGVKLSLHAGELVLGMVPPEGLRFHIREAVLVAGADRIGHGVDIPHEADAPELLNILRRRQVAMEINLTSNAFILGVKNDAHPVRLYARHGVPFVISTDDSGISRNNLSNEYLLYVSRYKPSYDQLKQVVYNSLRYSFLPANIKREEVAKLDRRFARFEAVVARLPRSGR